MVHIHHGILAIKKNSFESVLMRWMKLEPIIQSKVGQKGKHQYNILTHIYGMLEKEMATHSSTLAWKIPQMEELVNDDPICEIAKETEM